MSDEINNTKTTVAFAFTLGAMEGFHIRRGSRSVLDLVDTIAKTPSFAMKFAVLMGATRGFLRLRIVERTPAHKWVRWVKLGRRS